MNTKALAASLKAKLAALSAQHKAGLISDVKYIGLVTGLGESCYAAALKALNAARVAGVE